jgi:hypothetical protein
MRKVLHFDARFGEEVSFCDTDRAASHTPRNANGIASCRFCRFVKHFFFSISGFSLRTVSVVLFRSHFCDCLRLAPCVTVSICDCAGPLVWAVRSREGDWVASMLLRGMSHWREHRIGCMEDDSSVPGSPEPLINCAGRSLCGVQRQGKVARQTAGSCAPSGRAVFHDSLRCVCWCPLPHGIHSP